MCTATRYPEAFPLRNIKARSICNALKTFVCQHGFPKVIQSNRGTNLTVTMFKQLTEEFGIKHVVSSAYHPENQGVLERFNSTLNMLRAYCVNSKNNWGECIPFFMFTVRDTVHKTLCFTPF